MRNLISKSQCTILGVILVLCFLIAIVAEWIMDQHIIVCFPKSREFKKRSVCRHCRVFYTTRISCFLINCKGNLWGLLLTSANFGNSLLLLPKLALSNVRPIGRERKKSSHLFEQPCSSHLPKQQIIFPKWYGYDTDISRGTSVTHNLSLGTPPSRVSCMTGHLTQSQSFSYKGCPSDKVLLSKLFIPQDDSDLKLLREPKLPNSDDVTLLPGTRSHGRRKTWIQGHWDNQYVFMFYLLDH